MSPRIDAVLLAAGSSQRFGRDKRLHPVAGKPMLQRAILPLLASVRQVWVILREEDAGMLAQLLGDEPDGRVRPLLLPRSGLGMGSNLARAIAALPPDCDGVLVALADMPWIRPATVSQLVSAFQPGSIIVPVYERQQGHPVLFPRQWFARLATLQGDRGARSVLEESSQQCVLLPIDDPGVLQDVDHPPA